ncbi:MAG: rhamnulokinase [Verrucomicrobia bacterium]|nr:rhamnulokinase [Verrucomicrobiota bacterium]
MSNNFYIACELGADTGRIMLGSLHQGKLTMSEARRFQNLTVKENGSLQWNIPQLYQETLAGLRGVGAYEEPVESISCNSWAADYLLFEQDGSLITPTFHHHDPRSDEGMKNVFSKVPWETIYEETGVQQRSMNTLFQLGAEKSRRLNHAQLMPVADGFNYLLAGVPRIEMSLASPTQLYNPVTRNWSDRLLNALRLSPNLFPPVVRAGTVLGALRPEVVKATGLEDAQVVTSCSHEIAAALAGLPIDKGESWAYLRTGSWAVMGTELDEPIINDASREMKFTNEIGYGGSVRFSKRAVGFWILEECQRFWMAKDRALDSDMLTHLAGSSTPFESLVNLADPRFLAPGDMPLKIQAFCRETNQTVPRKPGPIIRCVLESLALLYRKTLWEIESLTGREITRLYILGEPTNTLLNHFTANALRIPVVIAPTDATSIGNVVVQALALGHIRSLDHAREIVRNSFKMETIVPHAVAWDAAYDRLAEICSA